MDANETLRDKSRWELHKNAVRFLEQNLEVTFQKNKQPYDHITFISEIIEVQHSGKNKDELISDVL